MTRLEKLLLALAVLLVLVVAGLAFLVGRLPGLGSPPPTPPSSGVVPATAESSAAIFAGAGGQTALLAYAQVQQEALAWAADARLLNVTGTWSQVKQAREVTGGAAPWHFTFFAPSRGALLRLAVDGTQVGRIGERPLAEPPQTQAIGGWQIDSDEAIQALLSAGGSDFVQRARPVALVATLDATGSGPSPTWFFSLVDRSSAQSFTLYLDARTGAILRQEPAP